MTEESLFLAALEYSDLEARQAFLRQACGDEAALLRRVEQLLAAYAAGQQKLEPPEPIVTEDHRGAVVAGVIIAGRYRLLERIGEGGMGEVWVAKQTEPVQRKVALKLIRADRDSRQVIARFEAERQALALMDHPNIARVLDGGATETGRPFFVMELVNGLPLTRFCDEAKLTPRERLELFVPMCQAVQHAHQKGIIHRDLKPSNVLVTLYDGKPVPKIIDFGVAKAMAGRLTDESLATEFGAVVGTFEYMAPEQAGFSALDVDTRADIYALGVILYELLTGLRPFDSQRLRKAALDELVRILREEEPPRPSTRLSTDKSAPSLASLRQTEPSRLTALMRGELDWVVMKCLEKDRTRRYETANGLARDIQRYLDDDVVEARPPSAGYRLRKFGLKHRAALAMAAVIALLLVVGTAVSTWQAVRAMRAEAQALAARDEATEERLRAEAALQHAKLTNQAGISVLTFFGDRVLAAAQPKSAKGGLGTDVTIRAALEAAEPAVSASFPDQPSVEASVRAVLGQTYLNLGEWERAARHYTWAEELSRGWWGPDHPFTADMMVGQAVAHLSAGKADRAVPLFEQALPILRAKLPPDHPGTLQTMGNLVLAYGKLGRADRALPLFRELLKRYTALGTARYRAGDWSGAAAALERAVGLGRPDDPATAANGFFLAMAHWRLGDKAKARAWFDKSVVWMAKGKNDDPELKRFRAEAAELLGVKDKP
jgi:non-specific serine/threonine protein kinase/serine/threonine-protein kinase